MSSGKKKNFMVLTLSKLSISVQWKILWIKLTSDTQGKDFAMIKQAKGFIS